MKHVVDKDREINIIDFNRWGYDDPYEEFNRLMCGQFLLVRKK